ncbi:MAG: hypothetical protein KA369_21770, partial [Spirochaetes bacterium]|nr:hypothetical protein [Spirochaetota bacterium]
MKSRKKAGRFTRMKTINVKPDNYIYAIVLALIVSLSSGCNGYMKSNNLSQLLYGLVYTTKPLLNPLVISATGPTSIYLERPILVTSGNPLPTVQAWIGDSTQITMDYTTGTVGGIITAGPIDVSGGPYPFVGLAGNTTYDVYVVAKNSEGFSVQKAFATTGGSAPVLNPLSISGTTSTSITLVDPSFYNPGNPATAPDQTRTAYIGYNGIISVDYNTGLVTNDLGSVDLYTTTPLDYPFVGLTPNTAYRIIVVAENASGFTIREIVQNTAPAAPVLGPLSINATSTSTQVDIDAVTFVSSGNPAVTTGDAYIGVNGAITVDGMGIVGGTFTGPQAVSTLAGTSFAGLTPSTFYRIILVSSNASGASIRQMVYFTGPAAPALGPLSINATSTSTQVDLDAVTFTSSGNPVVTTGNAYIGVEGAITVDGQGTLGGTFTGPQAVSTVAGTSFAGLTPNTYYRIIVVSSNASGASIRQKVYFTGPSAPVLGPLSINASSTSTQVDLDAVTFTSSGTPAVTTGVAYIGVNGTITVDGQGTVGSAFAGPQAVSTLAGTSFAGLTPNTYYRIIVVSSNASGASIRQTVYFTGPAAPVLGPLSINATSTSTQVDLDPVSFTSSGTPAVTTGVAYIGVNGTITVDGQGTVGSAFAGPQAVSTVAGTSFAGLTPNTYYRIIVVSSNASGASIRQTVYFTGPAAPVLGPLSINATSTSTQVDLDPVSFTSSGTPAVTTGVAYIGLNGTITVDGQGTVGSAFAGPQAVSTLAGTSFAGLTPNTYYRIIVVSSNASGASIRQTVYLTGPAAPVLGPLSINATSTSTQVDLDPVSFTSSGTPAVTTGVAYIGLNGTITVDGQGTVGSAFAGPQAVSTLAGTSFAGLTPNTYYRIIVVSSNASGASIRQTVYFTGPAAPVLGPLSINATSTSTQVDLDPVSFASSGTPAVTTGVAYIGLNGTITVDGQGTVGSAFAGPQAVSTLA